MLMFGLSILFGGFYGFEKSFLCVYVQYVAIQRVFLDGKKVCQWGGDLTGG
jgi:hypothetical protein